MSILQSNSELSESNEPTLYFLEMDSDFNLRARDTQLIPLHILNYGTDSSHTRFFLPIQNKEDAKELPQVLVDTGQESAIQYVALQDDIEAGQQHTNCQSQQQSSSPLDSINVDPSLLTKQHIYLENNKVIENYVHISDNITPPRAIAVLPTVLQIRRHNVITPRRTLLPRTRFGPIQGVKHTISLEEASKVLHSTATNKQPLFMLKDEDEHFVHIDVTDKDKSNWIGLLPLGDDNSANVWIYEENSALYIITTDPVSSRKPLMLGYSKKYALNYGLPGPTKDIHTAMSTASPQRRHTNLQ